SSIALLDADGALRIKAYRGLSETYRSAVDAEAPTVHGVDVMQPSFVRDVEDDPAFARMLPALRAENVRALAAIPLIHRQKLLGKLVLYSRAARTFTSDEVRLAQSIATEVAHAVARKLAEAEVQRLFSEAQAARAAAESASRMKDEFLGVVSHELRTPLSAILGWAAILRNEPEVAPATRAKGLLAIDRNARAQLKIIEDMLDVSRIITGKLVIDPRPTGLASLVVEAIDAVKASAIAKDISLTVETNDDPMTVVCDPERVRQVVWNLLSNAIKFTPRGGAVEITLRRQRGAVSLEVSDTGAGIAPEFLPHVFERFRQADSSTTRAQSGLGLGLAIVRHLVELHGGQVRADSAGPGKGSRFTVTLPIKHDPLSADADGDSLSATPLPPPPLQASPAQLNELRILLVDDDHDARDMLRQALALYGAKVSVASSVREALQQLSELRPQVIVSDIGMPGEDGYALIERVRALGSPEREVRAIAFTAYARPADRQRALAAGYDAHVTKPIDVAALANLIAEVSQVRSVQAVPPGTAMLH
ncbi:MAG TPA: ATP-binding protein, partial [Polyangiales bacterium]|nr:ATP-binding protein [Polyangiales bacterium]